jgi:hypothetical protein
MNAFIFVSVVCIIGYCEFKVISQSISETKCTQMKRTFLEAPFKKEVTMALAQCMKFKDQDNSI